MAKTTSQIVAENKLRNELIQAAVAHSKAVDQAQSSGNAKAVAKTQSVLSDAGLDDVAKTVKDKTKIVIPDEKKSSTDKLWDRGSKSTYSAETAAKQKVNSAEKKLKDFEEKSDLDWTDAAARELYENQRRKLQAEVDSAGADLSRKEDAQIQQRDTAEMDAMSDEDRQALEQYAVNQIRDQNLPVEMVGVLPTAQEEAAELMEVYGQQRVNELAETFMRQENTKLAEETEQKARQFADDHGVVSSLLTVPVSAVSGVVGTVGQLQGAARNTGRYATLDPSATGTVGDTFTSAVRGQVAQNIEQNTPGILGKAGSVVYQGAMGLADTIARGWLGGGAAGGAALAATGSFSQTMADAAKQGASPAQAAMLATATAFIEAAAEKLPLDNLIKTAKGKGGAKAVWNILRQMGIEIAEEEATLIGTFLAEAAILQEKSDYNQNITAQILLGATPEEAREAAALDVFWEAVNTAAVSAVSGVGGGIGAAYADHVNLLKDRAAENPQLTKPDKKTAAQARAELIAQHAAQQGKTEAQQAQEAMDMAMEEAAQKVPQTAPAPLTEERQHMENAAAVVNGVEPKARGVQQTDPKLAQMQQLDADRQANKQRQQAVYEELQAAKRHQRDLQKQISRAEQKLKDTGRGSQARIDQLKAELEQQDNLVAQLESQNTYFTGDYERTLEEAVKKQEDVFENAREEARQAITAHEAGLITDSQLQAAQDKFNTAGQEVYRLKHMTQEQYAAELAEVGLIGDNEPSTKITPIPAPSAESRRRVAEAITKSWEQMNRGTDLRTPTMEELSKKQDVAVIRIGRNAEGKNYDQLKADISQKAERENWYDAPYFNDDTGMPIFLTKKTLTHSYSNLTAEHGTNTLLALQHMPEIIENAVLVDIAPPRNTRKPETRVLTFFAAAENENGTIPVKLTVKEYNSQSGNPMPQNIKQFFNATKLSGNFDSLYDLEAIEVMNSNGTKKEFDASAIVADGSREPSANSTSNSTIKVTDLLSLVKGDAEKYLPKTQNTESLSSGTIHTESAPITDAQTVAYTRTSGAQGQSAESGQQNGSYISKHLGKANAAIAEFRQSDEYKAMSRDQRVQAINEIMDYFTKVVDENEPGIAVVSDGGQRNLTQQSPGIKGTGAAEANFTGTAAYDNLLSDDNVQRERKGDGRYIEVPKTDADGRNVSEFTGNSMNSKLTPESFTDSIKKLVQEGQVSHDVQTNEESLRKGAEMIAADGSLDDAVRNIHDYAAEGNTSPEYIAKATLLYQQLTSQLDQQLKNGNVDSRLQRDAEDVYISLSQMATASGRAMQLFNLFRKMTPEGQVNILRKEIQQEIAKYQKRGTVKKDYQPQMDEQLLDIYRDAAEEFQKASTPKAKQAAEQKMQQAQNTIYAWEAAKMPTTFKAKWDAWRYMAMLGNAKTQIRNVFGNALMMPYTAVKRKVVAVLEKGISKDQRTKAVFQDRELLDWAKTDRADDLIKTALERSAKLGDDLSSSAFSDNIKTFGDSKAGELLNTLEKAIGDVTSAGDIIFKNREYAQSLAGFLKARGYTAADARSGRINTDVMNEARNYAINEALKATFNDANMLSDALSGLRYNGENKALRAINTLGEGLMPFRKTPANVVMRFKDYSPIGLAQGLGNMAFNVRSGKVSAAAAIDQISSGLTGTGAMLLGHALAGGLFGFKLTASGADEDEKRQGHQDYALEFSWNGEDYSYKIDWASPANLPLFVGANLRQMLEAEDTASFYTAAAGALSGMWEPLLELSCLSSLNDLAEGLRYAEEGEAIFVALSKAATSYFTQGIPALARQTTQAATQSKQTTFVTSDDPMIQKGQKALAGVGVGNAYKTDKLSAWGEKETEDNWMIRAVNAFANPGTLKKIDNSALEQEITRLNSVQETNVTPDTAPRTVSYTDKNGDYHDNVRLTEEQYQALAATQGQTARTILESMIASKDYAAMSDEEKAKAISEVYSYAKAKAEITAIGESHTGYSESWMMELEEGKEAAQIINRVANSELNRTMSALTTAWEKGYDTTSRSNDLQWAYDAFAEMSAKAKTEVKDAATASVRSYIEAREGGVSHDRYLSVLKQLNSIQPEAGNKNPRDIQKAETVVKASGLTNKQKELLVKQQVSDTQDENIDQLKALGYGIDVYPKLYRDYLDYTEGTGKKNRTITKWRQDYGIDYSTAKKLYEVFRQ